MQTYLLESWVHQVHSAEIIDRSMLLKINNGGIIDRRNMGVLWASGNNIMPECSEKPVSGGLLV